MIKGKKKPFFKQKKLSSQNKTTGEVEKSENRAVSDFIDLKTSNESGYRYIAVSKYLG